ncbi:MAG: hypothetical protein IKK41_00425 [Oscillospiraceae bacterium]|nr:hypothetical protein [Oscillospiraceae bacterium]
MQNRTKLFISAVLLIIMILSMVTPALATETERTTEHVHTWTTLSAKKDRHYLFCTTCNETQDEPHTFNSEEICIVCGNYFHTHKWQRIEADLQFHTVVCTGCGESETVTHRMREGVCTVCGYETHTHVMQYVGGATYDSGHEMKCTSCSTIGTEDHTYGSDDKCTVCGRERPCEHQWTYNGAQSNKGHVLSCTCGRTMSEPHSWTWNATGNYVACTVCRLKDSGHFHIYIYPDGTHCIECGYYRGTVESKNQPNGTEPAEIGPAETEPAEIGPAETEPVDTKPAKTEPVDTKLAEIEPVDTLPVETEPVETEPTETNPTEVTSGEADPEETETEASDTFDEEDGEVNSKPDGSTLIWVVAVVSIAAGLITGLFLWKKKSF